MYSVGLNNRSVLFDDGEFDTLEEAVEFARHRGGKYSVNISSGDPYGDLSQFYNVHLSYDSGTDLFSLDTGSGWQDVPNDKLIQTLNRYV